MSLDPGGQLDASELFPLICWVVETCKVATSEEKVHLG